MTATLLEEYGGGVERDRHVSLVDCMRLLAVAGIEDPGPVDPAGARDAEGEVQARVWRTSLYAVRDACPDAPAAPPVDPPAVCYSYAARQQRRERPDATDLWTWSDSDAPDREAADSAESVERRQRGREQPDQTSLGEWSA